MLLVWVLGWVAVVSVLGVLVVRERRDARRRAQARLITVGGSREQFYERIPHNGGPCGAG